jgi:broad-specificity NMP kinase
MLEVLFTDQDRTLEVDATDRDPTQVVDSLIQAIGRDDADEAERVIQAVAESSDQVEPLR